MELSDIIFNLPPTIKRTIRKLEKTLKKLANCEQAVIFNQTCLKENILPKYSNIKTHDPAARNEAFTLEYRKQLVHRQIGEKKVQQSRLLDQLTDLFSSLRNFRLAEDRHQQIKTALHNLREHSREIAKSNILKKLNHLYNGTITLPQQSDGYINLSKHILTEQQKQVLNLGLNCHLQPKFDETDKKAELEMLYESILNLNKQGKITINPSLHEQLQAEGTKHRSRKPSQLLPPHLRQAVQELKTTPGLIIKRADKSNIYVLMDEEEYLEKINHILQDPSKFQPISRNPINQLKSEVNKLITKANAASGQLHFSTIIGDFLPGYMYGNVKTHKPNHPLRPIISQVPTPTYKIAKQLNEIISPFIPSKYSLKSTDEFLDILRTTKASGLLASLDAESLFSNIPVTETISIILDNCYNHPTLPPPKIPAPILENLLRLCTTKAPFRSPSGQLFYQVDGIAMGSPLGPTFANYYMCDVENRVLQDIAIKPHIYCRYLDDLFVSTQDTTHLHLLKQALEDNSVLKFTTELSLQNKLPFLDVSVHIQDNTFVTSVYRKPTDLGRCMNAASEAPTKYKISVIRAYLRRAYKICSNWTLFHHEVGRIKQILINNGYSNHSVDTEINKFLDRIHTLTTNNHKEEVLTLQYKNQMSEAYRVDERTLQEIIHNNITCTNPHHKIRLSIYYKSPKISNLLINNKPHTPNSTQKANVVYQFTCPFEGCKLQTSNYIGFTRTTLSRRLTYHMNNGAIKQHIYQCHQSALDRETLVSNTKIIKHCPNPYKLQILEAICIRDQNPSINKQNTGNVRTLSLFSPRPEYNPPPPPSALQPATTSPGPAQPRT